MRRVFGVVLAGAIMTLPAFSQSAFAEQGQAAPAQPAQGAPAQPAQGAPAQPAQGAPAQPAQAAPAAQQKFTLEGDVALWSVAIKADKTADYEQVLVKLKEALTMSQKPEAKQQLAGWKVMRGVKNPATGDIIYTHIITPVPGADYATMQNIYDAITDPAVRTQVYEMYRGAFSQNLGVNSGKVVADFSK